MKKLIIMRGLPGSGKSFLANSFYNEAINKGLSSVIHSTDEYFYESEGVYKFDSSKLHYYHSQNLSATIFDLKAGIQIIIVDNTNITTNEIFPYAKAGLENGYEIWLAEPMTEWKRNVDILVKRNSHNVPKESIQRMKDRWQDTDDIGQELAFRLGSNLEYDVVTQSLYKEHEYA